MLDIFYDMCIHRQPLLMIILLAVSIAEHTAILSNLVSQYKCRCLSRTSQILESLKSEEIHLSICFSLQISEYLHTSFHIMF